MRPDIVVVGGGIVGAAAAAACARRGLRVTLCEREALASGASNLELALIPTGVAASPYLELHHFTGGSFFLDRSPPDEWPARRIDARAATLALAIEARSYGSEVLTGCDVKGLLLRSGAVQGVLTDRGEIQAGVTVVAAGAWTWKVCRDLPVHVPIRPLPGVVSISEPVDTMLDAPLLAADWWRAQDERGRVWTANPERADLAPLDLVELERRELTASTVRGDDGVPGPAVAAPGLVLIGGHGAYGVAHAPASGAEVAELVARGAV